MNKNFACIALLYGSLLLSACSKNGEADKETLQKANTTHSPAVTILAFATDKLITTAGDNNYLHWHVQGASKLNISPEPGDVSGLDTIAIHPDITTVYTLTATDEKGNISTATTTANVFQDTGKEASYPIMFVTQVPMQTDQAARLSAFANHMTGVDQVPRGGDLMLRYQNGKLRNLTREAGLGMTGFQGNQAIAVREPAIHWSGEKAVFSMLTGAPQNAGESVKSHWQIYEVRGLAQNQKAQIRKLPFQDENYNNVSPLYGDQHGNDDSIIFTSDRPHNGKAHLYPQLDEYEATPTISGIWKLYLANGQLQLLNHTPSGAFNPILDSFGRLLFTRWDHLQQDQLADRDRDAQNNGFTLPFNSFNYADDGVNAHKLVSRFEQFPESRVGGDSPYGKVNGFRSNFFTIWQINQDGSGEETLNHLGQHELAPGYIMPNFSDDPHLKMHTTDKLAANAFAIRREGGLFHLREDPRNPGTYYATHAREAASYTTNHLVRLTASPDMNPEKIIITPVTATSANDILEGGRYRNPLPLSDGRLLASHTTEKLPPAEGLGLQDLRLKFLQKNNKTGLYAAGEALTTGIQKTVSWWSGNVRKEYKGTLWELEAVEVRPHRHAVRAPSALEAPERAVLAEAGVSEADLRAWLQKNELALIVTRDQTSRDRADMQQPYNLQVPGGIKTISRQQPDAKIYPISYFQIFEADLLRAYADRPGRRALATPVSMDKRYQRVDKYAPSGAVKIAADGSTAAFVPAGRALTWQSTDAAGNAIVRERNWITFQRGEMRVCASCHGVNSLNQAGLPAPANKPLALKELLGLWKTLPK